MDKIKQLEEEKVSKLLVSFSIPAIVGMLVNALYNVIDRIFIGRGVDSLGLAGIAIGFPILIILFAFAVLVAIGATSLMSIKLGEKKREEAEKIMGNALTLMVVISILLSILSMIFLTPLLKLFGASNEVLPYAKDYIQVLIIGSTFNTIGYGLNNFIRADGNPRIAMIRMLISALLNALFAPIFIFIFKWGMFGAGMATAAAQTIAAIWGSLYFLRGKSTLKIRMKYLKPDFRIFGKVLSLGFPAFSMQLIASLITVILNKSLMAYGGDVAISGMGIITSIQNLLLMPIIGITQGAQPIIGYNFGAEKYDRVKDTLKLAIIGGTIIVLIGYLGTRLFPEQFILLFNKNNPALIQFGTHALLIYFFCLPVIGFQIVGSNYFQAVGKVKPATVLNLTRQMIVLIPALLILPRFFGLNGVLYAAPLSDFLSAIITGLWLWKEIKQLGQKHQDGLQEMAL